MRAWRTRSGGLLLKGPRYEVRDFVTPSGAQLGFAHRYLALDTHGVITDDRTGMPGAVQEHFSGNHFRVEGHALLDYFCEWNSDLPEQPPSARVTIVEGELQPVAPPISDDALLAAIREYDQAREQQREQGRRELERRDAERRSQFLEALGQFGPAVPLRWEYESVEQGVAVVRANGQVIFRARCEGHGKYLFRELENLVREHWGDSARLELNLPDAAADLAFDPE